MAEEATDEDFGRSLIEDVGICSLNEKPWSNEGLPGSNEGRPGSRDGLPGSKEGLYSCDEYDGRPGSSDGREYDDKSGLKEEVEGLDGGEGGAAPSLDGVGASQGNWVPS